MNADVIEGWNPDLPSGMRSADIQRVSDLLTGLGAQHESHVMAFDGEPHSKGRPRLGKGGRVHTDNRTRSAEGALARRFFALPTFTSNVGVACIFFRSNRQRIDVDNLLKLVLDSATKGRMWHDDSQVTGLIGVIEYDAAYPRTIVAFGQHESTMLRGESGVVRGTCPVCGIEFIARTEGQTFCSRPCGYQGRTATYAVRSCAVCASEFTPARSNQRSCSDVCSLALKRARQQRVDARRAPRNRGTNGGPA